MKLRSFAKREVRGSRELVLAVTQPWQSSIATAVHASARDAGPTVQTLGLRSTGARSVVARATGCLRLALMLRVLPTGPLHAYDSMLCAFPGRVWVCMHCSWCMPEGWGRCTGLCIVGKFPKASRQALGFLHR
jgi:hypothetical protein